MGCEMGCYEKWERDAQKTREIEKMRKKKENKKKEKGHGKYRKTLFF